MPMYPYKCEDCEHETDEFQFMSEDPLTECPKCGGEYKKQIAVTHTTMREYKKPIEMHSIAYNHPDDVAAFKRRHPDVQCSTDEKDPLYGVPIAKSRHQKMQILKAEGFTERN